jgi:hypothetical protein
MKSTKRLAKTSPPCTRVWERRIKLLLGLKRISRVAAGCWPRTDGHRLSSPSAVTLDLVTRSGGWVSSQQVPLHLMVEVIY